jgi:dsDNA-specific endonuclease/ATPase MutS2
LPYISLIALALVAKENNYTRPVLTEERVLEIEGGRHPLQELCVDDFVPNDTFSRVKHSLMKIITGPNSSGKSVYLKQVMKQWYSSVRVECTVVQDRGLSICIKMELLLRLLVYGM